MAGMQDRARWPRDLRRHRHWPPTQQVHSLPLGQNFQEFLAPPPPKGILGKKNIPTPPWGAAWARSTPHLLGRSDKEGMADLQEDPTVPSLAGGVLPRPVLQLFHDLQGVLHRPAGRAAPSVHYRTDAAGVVPPFFWIHFAYLFSHRFTSHPSTS